MVGLVNNLIREVFGRPQVVLPVIHVLNPGQTGDSVGVAMKAGADGVFLIDHGGREPEYLEAIFLNISNHAPDFWTGLNFLGLRPTEAFDRAARVGSDGVWSDNAEVDELTGKCHSPAAFGGTSFCPIYFGGVAFKYQPFVENLEKATRIATRHMDVVTTSGVATGVAADIKKLKRMNEAMQGLNSKPIALASGVSATNVASFLPWVDVFIVATSIESQFGRLDPTKTKELVELVHGGVV